MMVKLVLVELVGVFDRYPGKIAHPGSPTLLPPQVVGARLVLSLRKRRAKPSFSARNTNPLRVWDHVQDRLSSLKTTSTLIRYQTSASPNPINVHIKQRAQRQPRRRLRRLPPPASQNPNSSTKHQHLRKKPFLKIQTKNSKEQEIQISHF